MLDPKEEEQVTRTFNPNDHLMQIKNRNGSSDYLPVQWRLVWFREHCPEGSIETEMLHLDLDRETEEEGYAWNNESRRSEKVIKRANGLAVFRATVKDGKGGIATGTKSEKAASFPDYIEKAETGAIGRALAALGYGTQFAPDLDEGNRLADAPVDRSNAPTGQNTSRQPIVSVKPSVHTATDDKKPDNMATDQQLASIRKLNQHLGKPEPVDLDKMTYLDAKTTITALSTEYNEKKQNRAPILTLEAIKKRAFDTGLVTTKGAWPIFNAEVLGEFVPDEKLKTDQDGLKMLDEAITERATERKAS